MYMEQYRKWELLCKPSTLTFRSSGETHEDLIHGLGGRIFVLEICSGWIERLREQSLTLKSTPEHLGGALPHLAARLNHEFHKTDSAAQLAMEGLVLEMLAEASRKSSTKYESLAPSWLKQARELITEQFSERLTLGEVAVQVGVHPVHLATTFRQKYGVTVGDFVRKLRVEKACAELTNGTLSLSTIALKAGFADQSHFSRVFKSYVGTTPARYRRDARAS